LTIRQAIKAARKSLPRNSDARFDALCLAEKAFGLSKTDLRLHADKPIDPTAYFALVNRRIAGEPLQYILGEWEFYGLRFAVGPGVLIPRPETELLVDISLEFLRNCRGGVPAARPVVIDLCAGSGCVGLSIAHHCPQAKVYLVELSGEALPWLRKNAASYPNAEVIEADVLNSEFRIPNSELILANPPYVRTQELALLPPEVRREPRMALDGGTDGLNFYRALAEKWFPMLSPGGLLACECGEGQAKEIEAIFAPYPAILKKDFNGIDRVVAVQTPASS